MEAAKQQDEIGVAAVEQRLRMSKPRMILISVMVFTALFIAWGTARMIV